MAAGKTQVLRRWPQPGSSRGSSTHCTQACHWHVQMYACAPCTYSWAHVSTYTGTCACTLHPCTCTSICTHGHTLMHTSHMHEHTHVDAHLCTHHTHEHTYVDAHSCTHRTCMSTLTHGCTLVHTLHTRGHAPRSFSIQQANAKVKQPPIYRNDKVSRT